MSKYIKEIVIKILAEQSLLETTEISENSTLEEIGIDSLALVEIIFSFFYSFNITISFNANDPTKSSFDISSISSIIKAVEELINSSTEKNKI